MAKVLIDNPALDSLCREWQKTKDAEMLNQKLRRNIEENMVEILKAALPVEGSTTLHCGEFKIKATCALGYKVSDQEKFDAAIGTLPLELQPLKKVLDETGIRFLRANDPQLYKMFANYLEVKPKKIGFTVEINGEKQ